jgi:tRNA pseudouridine13 synthase
MIYLPSWPNAYPRLNISGTYRARDEDFQVTELADRQLMGSGEHLYVYVEKRGTNTQWLARQLANKANVPLEAVSYAGLKDRHAITRQWFSIQLRNRDIPLSQLAGSDWQILAAERHGAKIKRGALGGNQFRLVIRDIQGDKQQLNQRLDLIRARGVPNYFGPQRFGFNGLNLAMGMKYLANKKSVRSKSKASMYISAMRSYLFNQVLAQRVKDECWDKPLLGEVFAFAGSLRGFNGDDLPFDLQRWREGKIHPTAPMWGRGQTMALHAALQYEVGLGQTYAALCNGLENIGLKQERRPTRLLVPDLYWQWQDDSTITLHFSLASGYYATALLKELGDFTEGLQE